MHSQRLTCWWSTLFVCSYFIDHSTQKTTWEDPRMRKEESIPLNQFKVYVLDFARETVQHKKLFKKKKEKEEE